MSKRISYSDYSGFPPLSIAFPSFARGLNAVRTPHACRFNGTPSVVHRFAIGGAWLSRRRPIGTLMVENLAVALCRASVAGRHSNRRAANSPKNDERVAGLRSAERAEYII